MKAVVAAFNQEKALVGAFSVITNLRMELFGALLDIDTQLQTDQRLQHCSAAAHDATAAVMVPTVATCSAAALIHSILVHSAAG